MAKLTESYLRGMIKQVMNEMYDDSDEALGNAADEYHMGGFDTIEETAERLNVDPMKLKAFVEAEHAQNAALDAEMGDDYLAERKLKPNPKRKSLNEGQKHGNVVFDNMFVAMANGADVDLEQLANYLEKLGNIKQGQTVNIQMDNNGIRWNGTLVMKGSDETAVKNFAHRMKAKFNSQLDKQSAKPTTQTAAPKNNLIQYV